MDEKGLPVYIDKTNRDLADSTENIIDVDCWYPGNKPAEKIWRCVESLRDLDDILETIQYLKNATKKKRRLKQIATPLHSLIININQLLNDVTSNAETKKRMTEEEIKDFNRIKQEYENYVPFKGNQTLGKIRNKLSAHVDKKITPHEAASLINNVDSSDFGKWLHASIHVFTDLLNLNIYNWSCKSPSEEYIRIMSNEPFIVTFKISENNELKALAGVDIAKESPKEPMARLIESIVVKSQWMFKKLECRIGYINIGKAKTNNRFTKKAPYLE